MLHSPDKNTLAEANPIEFEIEKLANVSVDEYEDWKASTYTDGRWRQLYTTTVAIRNRLP
jgi:uncharacterized HAD superfamily protein